MGKKRKYRKKIFRPKPPADLILRAEEAEQRVEELRVNITKSETRIKKLLDVLEYEYVFQYPKFDEWFFLIADFYIPKLKLMIEVDGPSHDSIMAKKREAKRRRWLKSQGIKVLRIKNKDTVEMTAKKLNGIIKSRK